MIPKLNIERTSKTFEQVLKTKTDGTRRIFDMVGRNFAKFCLEKHQCSTMDMVTALKEQGDKATYNTLQEWIQFNEKCTPKTVKMWFSCLSKFLKHMGVNLDKASEQLNFPKDIEEEKYPLKREEIDRILTVSGHKMKLRILTQLSSGMRRGEMLQLRKRDFVLGERIMIKIPAQIAKFNKARTTFVSSEVQPMLLEHLAKLRDHELVFGNEDVKDRNIGDSYASNLTRYLKKLGLDMRYESTGYHKINSHSFRAYFITKMSRHDENLAKKLSGQKGYLLQYDRMTDEEKMADYIKYEHDLFITKQQPKSKEIQELAKKIEQLEKENREQKENFMDTTVKEIVKQDKIMKALAEAKKRYSSTPV